MSAADRPRYGAGRFPFGKCQEPGCERAAHHRVSGGLICRFHKPEDVLFLPFIGQAEKFFYAKDRWVLGGGAAGGGKSFMAARLWLKQWALAQAEFERDRNYRTRGWFLFLRNTTTAVQQIVSDFLSYYKRVDENAEWNARYATATFPNGYRVQFGPLENDSDWNRYWGNEYTLVAADESGLLPRDALDKVDQRIRTTDHVLVGREQMYYVTNPLGGEMREYLKRRFVKVANPEERVAVRVALEDGRVVEKTQVYIPFCLYDNPAIAEDGAYEASIRTRSSAVQRALLNADWDVIEGAWIGDDWDPAIHIVEPFRIPDSWTRFKCADYGYASRSSVQWCAVDPDGDIVVYRSMSTTKKTSEDLGYAIRAVESEPLVHGRVQVTGKEWDEATDSSTVYGPLDEDAWNKTGATGPSIGETLNTIGCGFFKSKKSRAMMADELRKRLRKRTPYDAGGGVIKEKPGIRWFSTCKTRFRDKDGMIAETGPIVTIPLLKPDLNNPDLWDTDGDDHDADAIGYGLMSRPMKADAGEDIPQGQAPVIEMIRYRQEKKKGPVFGKR